MTETEEKVYMVNSLADIKDAINEEGGNVTDSTPYSEYASKISGATSIEELEVTPSTSAQTITASEVDGYSPVKVKAVTSSIDANIVAGNIKKDVVILGVTGTLEAGASGVMVVDDNTPISESLELGANYTSDGYTFTISFTEEIQEVEGNPIVTSISFGLMNSSFEEIPCEIVVRPKAQ